MLRLFKKLFFDFLFKSQSQPFNLNAEEIMQKAEKDVGFPGKNMLAVFNYSDLLVKKLVWQLKYRSSEEAARIAAEILHQEIISALADWISFENFTEPILIPTPLSKKKLALRGYNQTELVIREVEKIDQNRNLSALYEVLEKKKETADQTSMKTKKERLANLKSCFTVKNKEKIKDRNLIIIDDVITTGATANEMIKTLKKAGARKVKVVAIAH